jgi:hypothetical protein
MMEPDGYGFEVEVSFMALAACLTARKTLSQAAISICPPSRLEYNQPKCIRSQCFHEIICRNIGEYLRLTHNSCICKEDIEPAVSLDRIGNNGLHSCFIGRVELMGVDVDAWVERFNLSLVSCQICRVIVADVDGFGAIVGVLVCACTTDTSRGVGSWNK